MLVSELLLTPAALAYVGVNVKMMWHAAAAKAAANSEGYVHDSLLVIAGVLVSELFLTPAALASVGINVKMIWHAAAAMTAAPGDWNVPETLFAIVDNSHVFVSRWTILELPCCAFGAVVYWICDVGLALEPLSVPGECKKQSSAFSKEKGYDSVLQASTQALTPVDPGDFVKIKGWDGHSIDGSPSLGKGQASGRVDVPVGATKLATSFGDVDATPLHRSPQCVVLVNPGSRFEKMEKTVFVKEVEGKTKVRRVVDRWTEGDALQAGLFELV